MAKLNFFTAVAVVRFLGLFAQGTLAADDGGSPSDLYSAQNVAPAVAATAVSSGFRPCDALVAAGLGNRVFYGPDPAYIASTQSYYAGNIQDLKPWCIFQPTNTNEASKAVKTLAKTSPAGNWNIAIRAGGHTHWASNNVDEGVTIDLSQLNSTVYNKQAGTASIGPGARWGAVFHEVEKYGKTLTGGRYGGVGVGGFTLGGGASFYTGRRGFACDDIVNYEVVLGDGSIVSANSKTNSDLFKALKGGTNNLGLVTRFDMNVFDAAPGGLYGGLVFMGYEQKDPVLKQFVRLVDINRDNPDDTEVLTLTYSTPGPTPQIAINAVNVAGKKGTTSFTPLNGLPVILDDRSKTTYGDLITKYESPEGLRQVWYSLCFQNSIDVVRKAAELFEGLIADINGNYPGANYTLAIIYQPLPKYYGEKNPGGNILGLEKSLTKNSVIWLVQAQMTTVELESVFSAKAAVLTAKLEAYAASRNAATTWRYLNYVNPAQDPLSTYGQDNIKYLKKVAAKYDPAEFFQTRVTGGFKVSRVV